MRLVFATWGNLASSAAAHGSAVCPRRSEPQTCTPSLHTTCDTSIVRTYLKPWDIPNGRPFPVPMTDNGTSSGDRPTQRA